MRASTFGIAFITLGILMFGLDFITAQKAIDIEVEDSFSFQWSSVVGVALCVAGFLLMPRGAELKMEKSSDSKEVLMLKQKNTLKNKIKRTYKEKVNTWTSFKHGLNHTIEELSHAFKI